MVMETVVGLLMIALSFLVMGFNSSKEYLRIFYFVVGLVVVVLSSSIVYNTAELSNPSILKPMIYIGVYGLELVIFILLVKAIIDTITSLPFIKKKRVIKI